MKLKELNIQNHPVLNELDLDFKYPGSKKPFPIIVFIGENGSGKTSVLKEINNYNESKFVQHKDSFKPLNTVFLPVGIKSNDIESNIEVGITGNGKKIYKSKTLKSDGLINDTLDNKRISDVINSQNLTSIYCGGNTTKLIDGKTHDINIEDFSSGEQEILLKLRDLLNVDTDTDCVLIDEPEASLHPVWQKKIFELILGVISEKRQEIPQIFIATQSERVLESLVKRNDVLIIRLFRNNDKFNSESVNEMDLMLKAKTFEELDYLAFHIPSFKYHDLLFYRFREVVGLESTAVCKIDNSIYENAKQVIDEQNIEVYKRLDKYKYKGKWYETKMLPTYVRNRFHHPTKRKHVTEKELEKSIQFLRYLIQALLEKKKNS